jgi:pimeloyl-ACP methyl ester carboxylesterase
MHAPAFDDTLQTVWSDVGGLQVHARISESGDLSALHSPIIFVHGLGVSSRYMIPTIRALAKDYRVYAPDLPGFGRSEKPLRAMNVAELAGALVGWMDERKLGRCVLVCNSMGCQVAVEVAVKWPERVERLVLSGPTMDPAAASAFVQILRLGRDAFHEKSSLWFVAGGDYLRAGPLRVLETLRLAIADHVERKLEQVNAPALVVRGALDPVAPQRWVEEMVATLPMGRLAVIEGTGHAVNYSAAPEFARLIREFVE